MNKPGMIAVIISARSKGIGPGGQHRRCRIKIDDAGKFLKYKAW